MFVSYKHGTLTRSKIAFRKVEFGAACSSITKLHLQLAVIVNNSYLEKKQRKSNEKQTTPITVQLRLSVVPSSFNNTNI